MPAVPLGNDVDMPDHAQLLSLAPGDLAQIIVVIDGLEAHALSQIQDIAERPPDLPAERGVFFGEPSTVRKETSLPSAFKISPYCSRIKHLFSFFHSIVAFFPKKSKIKLPFFANIW